VNRSASTSPQDFEWQECTGARPALGAPVRTACDGTVLYSAATACVIFRGQPLYFCLPICRADFERDPAQSCLAPRLNEWGD
jgi:hypothetical protein